MNLHPIEARRVVRQPPEPEGWTAFWHGYFQMDKVRSAAKKARDQKTHAVPKATQEKIKNESEVERQILLNIVEDIDAEEITMFELGAGRGDWCLSLAGVVDHALIDCKAKKVRCLAVEGEPTHYQWTKEHLEIQRIPSDVVFGAVFSHNGTCRFAVEEDPASSYGQSISTDGGIEVPAYTVDTLARRYGYEHVNIFHVDVQGAEVHALLGAKETLENGSPDYFLIGTHGATLNRQIRFLLSPLYEVVMDHPPRVGVVSTPFGKANLAADGIMVLKRRRGRPFAKQDFRLRHKLVTAWLKRGRGAE